ncbi:MAG: ankyrin repeat domain-containing protein [Deltaproteobacteria bacterium]|jgi:ankyrin repeat protein|nr:ankyrin repeat domain-containing protein [Deltaproteobacteria bacterium]
METNQEHGDVRVDAPSTDAASMCAQQSELMVACAAGKLDVVRRLLDAGVDVNHVNAFGETPLTYAVAAQRSAVVSHLLAKGADIELPSRPAWSPLMYAAATGNHHILATLIGWGADVARRDLEGRLPVELARSAGHFRCASLLELRGMLSVVVEELRRRGSAPRGREHAGPATAVRRRSRVSTRVSSSG